MPWASVSMCAASESSAREWATTPIANLKAMKPRMSASARPACRGWPRRCRASGRRAPRRHVRDRAREPSRGLFPRAGRVTTWLSVEARSHAATLSAPRLAAFRHGEGGQPERDDAIEPPGADTRTDRQAHEHSGALSGAQQVPGPLPGRGRRAELLAQSPLGEVQRWHQHHARCGRGRRDAQLRNGGCSPMPSDRIACTAMYGASRKSKTATARCARRSAFSKWVREPVKRQMTFGLGQSLDGGAQPPSDDRDAPRHRASEHPPSAPSTVIQPRLSQDTSSACRAARSQPRRNDGREIALTQQASRRH